MKAICAATVCNSRKALPKRHAFASAHGLPRRYDFQSRSIARAHGPLSRARTRHPHNAISSTTPKLFCAGSSIGLLDWWIVGVMRFNTLALQHSIYPTLQRPPSPQTPFMPVNKMPYRKRLPGNGIAKDLYFADSPRCVKHYALHPRARRHGLELYLCPRNFWNG